MCWGRGCSGWGRAPPLTAGPVTGGPDRPWRSQESRKRTKTHHVLGTPSAALWGTGLLSPGCVEHSPADRPGCAQSCVAGEGPRPALGGRSPVARAGHPLQGPWGLGLGVAGTRRPAGAVAQLCTLARGWGSPGPVLTSGIQLCAGAQGHARVRACPPCGLVFQHLCGLEETSLLLLFCHVKMRESGLGEAVQTTQGGLRVWSLPRPGRPASSPSRPPQPPSPRGGRPLCGRRRHEWQPLWPGGRGSRAPEVAWKGRRVHTCPPRP